MPKLGHSILVIAYELNSREATYQDLGADYFQRHDADRVRRRCLLQRESIGFEVTLKEKDEEHAA